jgi:3-methylfumaryl-CoA hydratase
MDDLDLTHLRSWIGRSMEDEDVVTSRMAREFAATLSPQLFAGGSDRAPPGLHWCLSPAIVAADGLGADGHPRRGGFLPPVPLPRRMWAGGALQRHHPLPIGAAVLRKSTIADVTFKQGRSGRMCFVAVDHAYWVDGMAVIEERHEIVYRDAAGAGNPAVADTPRAAAMREDAPAASLHWQVTPNATLLFRYSALTFNGHRIHYDAAYATGTEGYAGLVVHGPLQATWLLNAAASLAGASPRRFTYRALSPLIAGHPVSIFAARASNGDVSCWTESEAGVHMRAQAAW